MKNVIFIRRSATALLWGRALIDDFTTFRKEDVEKCKQKDLLEQMLKEMSGEFPELGRVFVEERDVYLTYSLQMATHHIPRRINSARKYPSTQRRHARPSFKLHFYSECVTIMKLSQTFATVAK